MATSIRHEAGYGFERSVWHATAPAGQEFPRLQSDISADIVIIGGGYAGLSTAYHLAKANAGVVVLEAREPGWGASGRNNGGVVPDFAFGSEQLVKAKLGEERGERVCRFVYDSAERLRELVDEIGGEADLVMNGFLDLAHRPERVAFLKERFDRLSARGLNIQWLNGAESAASSGSPIYAHGGYRLQGAGHIHPLKFARALARRVNLLGGEIYSQSAAISLTQEGEGWRVRTANGSIKARKVLITQNAYVRDLWPGLRKATIVMQPWLVATRRLSGPAADTVLPGNELLGDSHKGPYFFRRDSEGRIVAAVMKGINIFGGKPDLDQMKQVFLKTFPQLTDVEFECSWQGLATLLPGEMPNITALANGVWAAYGFGRGVTMAPALGLVLSQLCLESDPDKLVFPVTELSPVRMGSLVEKILPAGLRLVNAGG